MMRDWLPTRRETTLLLSRHVISRAFVALVYAVQWITMQCCIFAFCCSCRDGSTHRTLQQYRQYILVESNIDCNIDGEIDVDDVITSVTTACIASD
jgi:hypothetical protein